MRKLSWPILLALPAAMPAWAHVVSMSTGELRIDGPLASYELRMPMTEVAAMADPTSILDHIHFEGGHLTKKSCAEESGTFVCRASYEFDAMVPETLGVDCSFYEATAPNHVHWLSAVRGANTDQEVFDKTFSRAELHFRPPSPAEALLRAFSAGFLRALRNWIGLLFLAALAIAAARSWWPLAGFFAGELVAILIGPKIPWPLPPRFLEAAMALTIAYLCVEVLFAANARPLPWIVGALAVAHGFYIAGFPGSHIAGAAAVQILALALLVLIARFLEPWKRPVSMALLAAGLAAFVFRAFM